TQDNEPTALGRIKNTGTVGESRGFDAQFAHLAISQIEHFDRLNGLRHLLSVCAHILHGCSTYAAGDAAQALHARAPRHNGVGDEAVPRLAGADLKPSFAFDVVQALDAGHRDFHDQSGPAAIGHQEIAATAQNK